MLTIVGSANTTHNISSTVKLKGLVDMLLGDLRNKNDLTEEEVVFLKWYSTHGESILESMLAPISCKEEDEYATKVFKMATALAKHSNEIAVLNFILKNYRYVNAHILYLKNKE